MKLHELIEGAQTGSDTEIVIKDDPSLSDTDINNFIENQWVGTVEYWEREDGKLRIVLMDLINPKAYYVKGFTKALREFDPEEYRLDLRSLHTDPDSLDQSKKKPK